MRKIIESTFVTLDGVVSTPERWSASYWDEEHSAYAAKLLRGTDALLLGRATYEQFAGSWPKRSGDWYTDTMNALPKHVASGTLTETTWNASVLPGDAITAVKALKDQDGGNLLKFGTGSFSRSLLENGLVDEYHFWIFPVVAGQGTRLLEGLAQTRLTLIDATTFSSGIVVHKAVPLG